MLTKSQRTLASSDGSNGLWTTRAAPQRDEFEIVVCASFADDKADDHAGMNALKLCQGRRLSQFGSTASTTTI